MCRIAQDSVALYDSLDLDGEQVWYGVGGLEVATTVERMQELKRRQGFARSYDLEGTELLSPAERRRAFAAPRSLVDPRRVLGAERRRGQGCEDRGGPRAEGAGGRRRVRGRRDRHRVRHPRRACARRPDRSRLGGVRAGAALRGHLGTDGRRARRGADPARRGAAPVGVDRPDPRARRRWTATGGRGSRWSVIRTCRSTSASARTTSASATTATSRSSRRRRGSGRRAARCSRR